MHVDFAEIIYLSNIFIHVYNIYIFILKIQNLVVSIFSYTILLSTRTHVQLRAPGTIYAYS